MAVKVSSEDMTEKFQLRLVDGCCDGWHLCLLYYLHVGECGCCGVEDFGVVSGLDGEYGSQALCLEAYEGSVVLW